ncbi:transmembrane protein 135-like protein [Leptotrombidium deliense]|uniref:Transmembrane protein 135-like protein n=1 Tax=Leptotrombidium deliense TaxID=299467 RepID=A0A443RX65_9ACAR|nr:transmembrane protein 135-like protein [Leptotrombidium deliense]
MLSPNTTIATYVLWKCIEAVYCIGIHQKLAPYPNATIALVYAASVNVIFYTGILEPSCLRPSYVSFMDRLTDHRLHHLNRGLLSIFGTDAAEGYEDFFPDLKPELCSRKFIESILVWVI